MEEKVLSPGLLGPKLQNGVKLSNTSDSMSSNVPRRKEGAENRKDVLTVLSKGKVFFFIFLLFLFFFYHFFFFSIFIFFSIFF